jgi:hypothetical protein
VGTTVGDRIAVSGGYDFKPDWLGDRPEVTGSVARWIPGQNRKPACVVRLDAPLTATGLVRGKRELRSGQYFVLGLRYVGQEREASGTVHVELCENEPDDQSWADREVGAWVESNGTYSVPA